VAQALIEAGNLQGTKGSYKLVTPIERLTVPSTVQSVLAARIDRLGEREKQLLQTASVIGKDFSEPILESVALLLRGDLEQSLQRLKDSEFIYQQSLYPVSEFAFKHPLTQEVALGSQLQERRKRLHAAVASAIREKQPDRLDELAALLAHHYEEAGETVEAVRFHRRAALRLAGSDQTGLIAHWQKVHVLSKTLPATREAMEHTLEACDMLLSNGWRTGMTEEERESIGAEGKLLAERLEDRRGLYSIELGLCIANYLCGYVADGFPPAERALALAEELGDLESRVEARCMMVNLHWHGGRFDAAIAAIEEARPLAGDDNSLGMDRFGLSISNWFGGMHGRVELWRGRPAASRALLDRCIQTARELGQQEVVSWSLLGLVELAWTTGIPDQALTHAQRVLELGEQVGSPLSEAAGHWATGAAHLLRGEPEAARAPLERAVWFSIERRVFRSWQPLEQACLADAYLGSGDAERARETAQQGVEFARRAKSYCFGLLAELALARALRTLDANGHRAEIEAGLGRCDEMLKLSQAHGLVPFIAEERARLAGALGASDASDQLREAQRLYAAVGATGHVARLGG
jgi:tetratricopeptide (TPR) repeat protein